MKLSTVFRHVEFDPHDGQREILRANERFKVAACGRRFGKSFVGGHRMTAEAFQAYTRRQELESRSIRAEYWIVGPNYSDSEKEFRVLWNDLRKLDVPFDRPGTYNDPLGGNMHISLWNGLFQVHAKSAAHPESLVGEGLHGVIMAEAAKIKERVWVKYVRPTLNDFTGWAMLTSTPEGKNWFYEAYRRGQDPKQVAWKSWRMPAWKNPHVYKRPMTDKHVAAMRLMLDQRLPVTPDVMERIGIDPEIGQLMLDLTRPAFNQEIAADFTEFVGRVFADFDEEVHVGDLEFNPEWSTYAAVDYGYTNPNVWLLVQVDPHGERVHVLDEVYQSGLNPLQFGDEILRRGLAPESMIAFFPDPASPGDTAVLRDKLRINSRGGTGGELKWRLDIIRERLQPWPAHDPSPTPRLIFDRKCIHTINDMSEYRYPEKAEDAPRPNAELPMKKNDHGPEALGRLMAGLFLDDRRKARRTRVRSSSMS